MQAPWPQQIAGRMQRSVLATRWQPGCKTALCKARIGKGDPWLCFGCHSILMRVLTSIQSLEPNAWPEQLCAILHFEHVWGFILCLKAH